MCGRSPFPLGIPGAVEREGVMATTALGKINQVDFAVYCLGNAGPMCSLESVFSNILLRFLKASCQWLKTKCVVSLGNR